jgi:tRNA G26 N,N-dimethylase Trm1
VPGAGLLLLGCCCWVPAARPRPCVNVTLEQSPKPVPAPTRSYNRIRGLLNMVVEELPDAPLYYNLHDMCKTVKATPMKMDIFR